MARFVLPLDRSGLGGVAGGQAFQHLLEGAGVGDLAVGRELVDEVREQAGHHAREGGSVHAILLSGLLECAAVNDVLKLRGGDGRIRAIADPGVDDAAESTLLKHALQTGNAAYLRAVDVGHDRGKGGGLLPLLRRAGRTCHCEYFIEKSHSRFSF